MPANILYLNLADAGTMSASSWIAAAPPIILQNQHVARRWRGRLGDTEWVLVDLLASQSIDTVALVGMTWLDVNLDEQPVNSNATTRIRISSIDATGAAGDVYDSGLIAGQVDAAYMQLVKLLPAPVSGRYVRIDISQASAQALQAGRFVVGLREDFLWNFSYGWSFGFADLSRRRKSAGGQTFVERDDRFRMLNLNFDVVDPIDRYGFVHEIDRLNGHSQDVLFIINPNSASINRDTIWGLMQELSMPTQPNLDIFSKSYSIEERR